MIELPLDNISKLLVSKDSLITSTSLSDDEDIGKFLGLIYTSQNELLLIDLISCIILSSHKVPSDIGYLDIEFFDICGITIRSYDGDYSIPINNLIDDISNLVDSYNLEYVMYIHTLFSHYLWLKHIDEFCSDSLMNDLIKESIFWKTLLSQIESIENNIKDLESNYVGVIIND